MHPEITWDLPAVFKAEFFNQLDRWIRGDGPYGIRLNVLNPMFLWRIMDRLPEEAISETKVEYATIECEPLSSWTPRLIVGPADVRSRHLIGEWSAELLKRKHEREEDELLGWISRANSRRAGPA